MRRWPLLFAILGTAALAASPAAWNQAFGDQGGPLHLTATYTDAQGAPHPLEFWRDAAGSVVRRTNGRAELRLFPSANGEDAYQLRNLVKRMAYDAHRANLYRLGIFTDRWSVQHLLDSPRGAYTLTNLGRTQHFPVGDCAWWRVTPQLGAPSDVCWSDSLGVPLEVRANGRAMFQVKSASTLKVRLPDRPLPEGWQEFDADEDLTPD